jgi:hypothetical protein
MGADGALRGGLGVVPAQELFEQGVDLLQCDATLRPAVG